MTIAGLDTLAGQAPARERTWDWLPGKATDRPSAEYLRWLKDQPRATPFVIPPEGGAIPIL